MSPINSISRASFSGPEGIIRIVLHTWRHGTVLMRVMLLLALAMAISGAVIFLLQSLAGLSRTFFGLGQALFWLGAGSLVLFGAYWRALEADATAGKVSALEERVRENPREPKLAWDLARVKLESYLDRNLRQVSAIFFLVLLVMTCGMILIFVGVWQALRVPTSLAPSALAAFAGVVVQFIGATFLIIYRSTMEQAKNYVVVLERINAVGMSINILESIEDPDAGIRNRARADLSRDLLGMYGIPSTAKVAEKAS